MNDKKIAAAKRAVNSLETLFDVLMYLDEHPNTEKALSRLEADIEASGTQEKELVSES